MLPSPSPLAPLDHKSRALTTIYAPRKPKPRKNKTAQSRMLNELPIKQTLSPFHPLPAIGEKIEDKTNTKVIVFNLQKNDTVSEQRVLHDVLKPLTPLRIHGYARKKSLEPLKDRKPQLPQQLLRENTYDVIEPIFFNTKVKRDRSLPRKIIDTTPDTERESAKVSPKTRFKKAAMQVAKLSSMPETGKLLCLRERHTFTPSYSEDDKSECKLQSLQKSPTQKLCKLSEIFQSLDTKSRHRDKMKKENSWF